MANSPHGKYTEIKEERDLMDLVALGLSCCQPSSLT